MKKFLTFVLLCLMSIAAWATEPSFDTSKHYYIKNVDADKYVVLNSSGNATISATNKTLFTIEGSGSSYTIKSGNTYLSASSWNTQPSTASFTWIIDEPENGKFTFEQNTTNNKGHLGLDKLDEGEKLYCNKQLTDHAYFVLVEPEQQTYTVHITGAPESTQVTYGDAKVGNGATITATGIVAADITPDEIEGYSATVTIDDNNINVVYVEKIKLNHLYGLSTANRGAWVIVDGVMKSTAHSSVEKSIDSADVYQQFAIYEYDGAKYLWNEGAQHFLNNAGQVVPIQQASPIDWSEENGNTYFFHFTDAAEKFININGSKVVEICYWSYADEGNMMHLAPVEGFNATNVANVIASDLSEKSFTVTITGAPAESNPQVTYNDQTVGNQGTIKASSIDAHELTATEIVGYYPSITIEGTTITVAYTQLPFIQGQPYNMTLRNKNMYYDAASTQIKVQNGAIAEGDLSGCFKIEGTYAEGFIFYSIGAGKYFKVDDTSADNAIAKATADADGATRYDLVTPSNNGVGFTFKIHGTNDNYINERGTFSTWKAGAGLNDVGGALRFTEVEVAEIYDITFNFTGVATGSTAIKVESGVTPTLPAIPDYVEYTITPALAAATANATYTINSSYKENALPFTIGQNKYYTIKQNRNPNLNIYVEGSEIKTVASSATPDSYYAWEFGGDWLNGFTLKNKGAAKYVSFGTDNPGDKTKATLVDAPQAGAYFDFAANGDYSFLKVHGSANAYVSNNGGTGTNYLTNWNTGNPYNDGGSQLIIAEIEFGAEKTYTYTVTDVNGAAYKGSFTTDSANPAPSFTGVDGYTLTDVTVNGDEITATINFPFPVNTATRIASFNDNNFLWQADGTDVKVVKGATANSNVFDWIIIPSFSNGAFTFTIQNVAANKYLYAAGTSTAHAQGDVTLQDEGTALTFASSAFKMAEKNMYLSLNSSTGDNGRVQYLGTLDRTHGGTTVRFDAPSVIPTGLEITIGATGYATFYDEVARAIPEGVKAYYCNYNEGTGNLDTKDITEETGLTYIPSYIGVVLEGKAGTYTFNKVEEGEDDYDIVEYIFIGKDGYTYSALNGTVEETTLDQAKAEYGAENIYVLSKVSDVIGFYKYEGETLGAHKAFYAPYDATEINGFALDFGGQTVGVSTVISATNLKAGFDIQGRKLNKMQKGINILNGKKIIK